MKRLVILLCLAAVSARAEPGQHIKELRAALQKELGEPRKGGKTSDYLRTHKLETLISQLSPDDPLTDERTSQLIRSLSQFVSSAPPEPVASLCLTLAKELQEQREQQARAQRESTQATLRSAIMRGLDATKAADLDAPLADILKLQKETRSSEPRSYSSLDSFQPIEHLLTAIQDGFLARTKSKFSTRSSTVLDGIRSAGETCSRSVMIFLPRSEFFQKLEAVAARIDEGLPAKPLTRSVFDKQVRDWISAVKTLDDLDEVLRKIDDLNTRQLEFNSSTSESNLTGQLRNYRRIYDDFRAGIGTTLNFSSSFYSSQTTDSLNGIKNLLVKFALPRILGTTEEFKPTGDETIQQYLQRVLDNARSTSNWQLMSRVLETAASLQVTTMSSRSDTATMRLFLSGLNLEQARQFSSAVSSYSAALRSGSSIVPPGKIGDMLELIKKAHPADYEAGIQLSAGTYGLPETSGGTPSVVIPAVRKNEPSALKSSDAPKADEAKPSPPPPSDTPAKAPGKAP
jgi:hypothetical protein